MYLRLAVLAAFFPVAALAQDWQRVSDENEFLSLVSTQRLTHLLYNIDITVSPTGAIAGDAVGWDVTGEWSWQDGYFCRSLFWGGDDLGYNCLLVEARGDELRFTVDQGTGRSASLRLR
ncbi:dihydrodipicolinate reductase [Loktanella sp. SALINAS62]|uniref:dihydrodipicolinate reductase n=1 Tax=Loktanella sp. SALINAS62 TaxID=2706124 RepID=UPI001B8D60A3|nr:dihydrodipicolinate reductase [Loktanella sp. SALINAS62]MBS1301901.1 dihydrodipicolinate reductase [Loktanella sp. SALINAS62]